jgi:hypothetical protein
LTTGRPPRLPACACLVVWGAELVTLAEATVWYHDWLLDYLEGPDGSYISAKSMADRLKGKVSMRTVEQARVRLGKLGLYYTFRRAGGREYGRVCVLPPGCVPKTNKAAQAMAPLLDDHIRSTEGSTTIASSVLSTRTLGTVTDVPSGDSSVCDEGGKGGEIPLSSNPLSERQLSSAVEVPENREVNNLTNSEQNRRVGETTDMWLARLASDSRTRKATA